MRAAGALALLGLAAGAAALEPTKVSLKQTCTGQGWKVDFPATVYPNTPQFNFTVSTDNFQAAGDSSFEASGSLGLANHPLGVFKFKADGSACGTQVAYVKDGVLGQVTMFYPPCPWATNGPLTLTFRVDIWTVLPAIPPLIGTGYEADVKLLNGGKELLCLKVDLAQPAKSGADKSQDKCGISTSDIPAYPPAADMHIPYVTVSLDDAPEHRWDAIVTPRKEAILTLINGFIDNISPRINSTIVRLILDGTAEKDLKRMPADYAAEMRGIAKATGVKVGFIWMMNMMYELTGFCTSVVAQDTDGHIMHGRNLDFGIFMGTDATTHWQLTQNLRNILLNVGFTKGGKTVYNATTYAGFVGLLSGSRGPVGSVEGFSATVDTRYDSSLDKGIIEWILGKNDDCQFLTFATRIAMETKTTYADALAYLATYKPLGPAYIIIGGAAPGQGAIIAPFGQKQPIDVWHLKDALAQGSFYILETNYDRQIIARCTSSGFAPTQSTSAACEGGNEARKTLNGCQCLKTWEYNGVEVTNYCGRPGGSNWEWCFVEAGCHSGFSWGWCAPSHVAAVAELGPAATPAPTSQLTEEQAVTEKALRAQIDELAAGGNACCDDAIGFDPHSGRTARITRDYTDLKVEMQISYTRWPILAVEQTKFEDVIAETLQIPVRRLRGVGFEQGHRARRNWNNLVGAATASFTVRNPAEAEPSRLMGWHLALVTSVCAVALALGSLGS